jgi:hypothetical protein
MGRSACVTGLSLLRVQNGSNIAQVEPYSGFTVRGVGKPGHTLEGHQRGGPLWPFR